MVKCRDIINLNLDGMWLVAGEKGLDRVVSWTYVVLTRPFDDHMNEGNFAMCSVDFDKFSWDDVRKIMVELNDLKISGFAVSIKNDAEEIPLDIIDLSDELSLPLFQIRWLNASFVDIAQSIGNYIVEENNKSNRKGEFLYNLLFGYGVDDRYISKIAKLFGMDFSIPHQVGIIVVDREKKALIQGSDSHSGKKNFKNEDFGNRSLKNEDPENENFGNRSLKNEDFENENLENDEHKYNYYMSTLEKKISEMEEHTLFLNFLNKGVVLLPYKGDRHIESELEEILETLDNDTLFRGDFKSTCILGKPYINPHEYAQSYYGAKSLIYKKDVLLNAQNKKVISADMMGIYKFLFTNGDNEELRNYCDRRLKKLEEYDSANSTNLIETFLSYYMNGYNATKTAESLFIHRNTLQYRLSKIDELLGLKADDYGEYLEIINCIMVKRMMLS